MPQTRQVATKAEEGKCVSGNIDFGPLRSLVRFMSKGKDKDALLSLFTEMERLGEDNRNLRRRRRVLKLRARRLEEENRQANGALNLAKYALEVLRRRMEEQQITIGWLRRRVGQRKDLQQYEKDRLAAITLEERLNNGSECDHTVRE